ncbi:MAG TPA: N-methyl-L-tryptophan oxidase [Vicinamibacteria bacterium]|nr:N-methyl-L-tryptophan oxidase [Vicinamibacteria bacterium]
MTGAEVIVAGLGAMGSAAAWQLARRGRRVVGFDRYAPPHMLGSTHGRSRIIREAYFEHPGYVPLLRRAYENWADLERESGRRLLRQTGGLMAGPETGVLFSGARRSAREHALPHEVLAAGEIRRRFPGFTPPEDTIGLFEPRAGMLAPEASVEAALDLARRHGAELRTNEPVLSWRADGRGVEVTTAEGTHRAARLILSAGPWLPSLLGALGRPLQVERQLFHWFEPAQTPELFGPDRCPVAVWEYAPDRIFATQPDVGDGMKAGIHHEGETTDPDHVRREPTAEDESAMRRLVERYMPAAAGRLREARVCLYTNTPDHHFVIDVHPDHPQVIVASPCSGHGFKFASVVGEILADLATEGRSRFDLAPFSLSRLAIPLPPGERVG